MSKTNPWCIKSLANISVVSETNLARPSLVLKLYRWGLAFNGTYMSAGNTLIPYVHAHLSSRRCKEQRTESLFCLKIINKVIIIQNYYQIPEQSIICPQGLNATKASFSSQILQLISFCLLGSVSSGVFFSSLKSTTSESFFCGSIILEVSFGLFLDSSQFFPFVRSAFSAPAAALLFIATPAVFRFAFEISSRGVSSTWLAASGNTFCFKKKKRKERKECCCSDNFENRSPKVSP